MVQGQRAAGVRLGARTPPGRCGRSGGGRRSPSAPRGPRGSGPAGWKSQRQHGGGEVEGDDDVDPLDRGGSASALERAGAGQRQDRQAPGRRGPAPAAATTAAAAHPRPPARQQRRPGVAQAGRPPRSRISAATAERDGQRAGPAPRAGQRCGGPAPSPCAWGGGRLAPRHRSRPGGLQRAARRQLVRQIRNAGRRANLTRSALAQEELQPGERRRPGRRRGRSAARSSALVSSRAGKPDSAPRYSRTASASRATCSSPRPRRGSRSASSAASRRSNRSTGGARRTRRRWRARRSARTPITAASRAESEAQRPPQEPVAAVSSRSGTGGATSRRRRVPGGAPGIDHPDAGDARPGHGQPRLAPPGARRRRRRSGTSTWARARTAPAAWCRWSAPRAVHDLAPAADALRAEGGEHGLAVEGVALLRARGGSRPSSRRARPA